MLLRGMLKFLEIIDFNINNQTKTAKNFIKQSTKIEIIFAHMQIVMIWKSYFLQNLTKQQMI